MEVLKVYVSDDTAAKFRETAMKKFKFKKGALSKAAELALNMWIEARVTEESGAPESEDG